MAASFLFFVMGLASIAWGFWGDFIDKHPDPSIASRFESGFVFLAVSFVIYFFSKRRGPSGD
jgi:hypothetical protein